MNIKLSLKNITNMGIDFRLNAVKVDGCCCSCFYTVDAVAVSIMTDIMFSLMLFK